MVVQYLRLQYPFVMFRSDFASGLKLTIPQATRHKSLQSSRAWPDLFIYFPVQHNDKFYSGLAIEIKKDNTTIILKTGPRKGHISGDRHIQEQALMLRELNKAGYYANFGVGFEGCKKIIDWYLGRTPEPENAEIF